MRGTKLLGLTLVGIVLFSIVSSLPAVHAAYVYAYPYMPPDLDGDANNDGTVDIFDIVIAAMRFSSVSGSPNWDPRADLNSDGVIDILDIAIMAVHYGSIEAEPVAYSTSFDFQVPIEDGDEEVWYNILTRVYVPQLLSGQDFYFNAGQVNDWVINVKFDGVLKYEGSTGGQACQDVNVELGNLFQGYHFLEFVFAERWNDGWVHFNVNTTSGQDAYLTRFRICVPNYSPSEYEYKIGTGSNLPLHDTYYITGFASSYIRDLYWGGLKMRGWQWNCTPYDTFYDMDFRYPVVTDYGEQPLNLTWGAHSGGLLDFQIVSWTFQPELLGPPMFRAQTTLQTGDCP